MSQALFLPFPECPKLPLTRSTTLASPVPPICEQLGGSLLFETDPDLANEFRGLQSQIEDERRRHLLTDEDRDFLATLPSFPPSPTNQRNLSTEAIPSFGITSSLGTTTQSISLNSSQFWAQPTYATSQNVALREEPSIFKVNNAEFVAVWLVSPKSSFHDFSWTHFFDKKPGKRLT
jgi:hypothetical protein